MGIFDWWKSEFDANWEERISFWYKNDINNWEEHAQCIAEGCGGASVCYGIEFQKTINQFIADYRAGKDVDEDHAELVFAHCWLHESDWKTRIEAQITQLKGALCKITG